MLDYDPKCGTVLLIELMPGGEGFVIPSATWRMEVQKLFTEIESTI